MWGKYHTSSFITLFAVKTLHNTYLSYRTGHHRTVVCEPRGQVVFYRHHSMISTSFWHSMIDLPCSTSNDRPTLKLGGPLSEYDWGENDFDRRESLNMELCMIVKINLIKITSSIVIQWFSEIKYKTNYITQWLFKSFWGVLFLASINIDITGGHIISQRFHTS